MPGFVNMWSGLKFSMFSRVVLSKGHLRKGMGQVPMKTPILTREIGVGRRPYVPASSSAPFCMFSCQLDSNSSVCFLPLVPVQM